MPEGDREQRCIIPSKLRVVPRCSRSMRSSDSRVISLLLRHLVRIGRVLHFLLAIAPRPPPRVCSGGRAPAREPRARRAIHTRALAAALVRARGAVLGHVVNKIQQNSTKFNKIQQNSIESPSRGFAVAPCRRPRPDLRRLLLLLLPPPPPLPPPPLLLLLLLWRRAEREGGREGERRPSGRSRLFRQYTQYSTL